MITEAEKQMRGATLSFEKYADSVFQRERILDMHGIRVLQRPRGWFKKTVVTVTDGDLAGAWLSLEAYARIFDVPFVPGDLDRTNRVPELDLRIGREPWARLQFRNAYATTLLHYLMRTSPHLPLSIRALARMAEFERDEAFMNNPFLPIRQRTLGLIARLERQRAATARSARGQMTTGRGDPDPVLFPGQPIERLSDWVRFQQDLRRSGDLMGALSRARLDSSSYRQLVKRFAQIISGDASLQVKYGAMLGGVGPRVP